MEIDYCYLGDGSDMITILTAYDRKSGAMCTTYVRKKGKEDSYVLASNKYFVEWLGYHSVSLRSDGESSITDVAKEIRKQVEVVTAVETTPKESHSSLGGVENAHGRAAGVVRTLKRALEKRYHCVLQKRHPVMSWLVRHSGWTITRFQPRAATGRTPYEELKGKAYVQPMIEFGEVVLFKAVGAEKDKLNPRYFKGVYVGRVDVSDENLILTDNGLFKARSIMRMNVDKRWDEDVFNGVIGTPWNPKSLHGHEDLGNAVSDLSGKSTRGRFITKALVEEHGPTDGCPACERKSYNAAHSFKCKNRFDALLRRIDAEPKAAPKPLAKAKAKQAPRGPEEHAGNQEENVEPMDVIGEEAPDVAMEELSEARGSGLKRDQKNAEGQDNNKKKTEADDADMIGIVDTNELVQEPEEDLTGEACTDPRGLPPDLVEAGMSEERARLKDFKVFSVRKRHG